MKVQNKSKAKIYTIALAIGAIFVVSLIGISVGKSASAASANLSTISHKILLNEMEDCYSSNYMYGSVRVGALTSDDKSSYNGPDEYKSFKKSIVKDDVELSTSVSGVIKPPTGFYVDKKYKTATCGTLFLGKKKLPGLIEGNSGKDAKDNVTLGNFLNNMGYSNEQNIMDSDEIKCITYYYKRINNIGNIEGHDGPEQRIAEFCIAKKFTEPGNIMRSKDILDNVTYTIFNDNDGMVKFVADANNFITKYGNALGVNFTITTANPSEVVEGAGGYGTGKKEQIIFKDNVINVFPEDSAPVIRVWNGNSLIDYEAEYGIKIYSGEVETRTAPKSSALAKIYSIGDYATAYKTARKYISGTNGEKEEVPDEEKYVLYKYYTDNIYDLSVNRAYCQNEKPSSYKTSEGYYYMYTGNGTWCETIVRGDKNELVAAFSSHEKYKLDIFIDLDGLMRAIYNLDIKEEEIDDIESEIKKEAELPSTSGENADLESDISEICYDIAKTTAWIICPVVKHLSSTAKNIYSWVADDFLSIDSVFFNRDSNNEDGNKTSVYDSWSIFVSFANTILIVFLMVVIFSQLTGVGIDNYGIKKVLPKIIISAILINLSFYVCQIAVELSNILGRAMDDMFTSFGGAIEIGEIGDSHSGLFNSLLSAISGGIITTTAANAIELAMSGGFMAILIPLLCALLTALIAIFFFFALLGLRKAGVVILVVLSPLAFVCYMLPNTKTLYDKWYKAFKGLLLLYPICGLMIGGGFFTAKVLASTGGDYFVMFTALMLMVVPFFLVPKLLTKSFAALDGIGATISGYGKKLGDKTSSRAEKAMKNSRRYQARQNEYDTRNRFRQGEANARRARRIIGMYGDRDDLTASQRMRLAQANQIVQGELEQRVGAYASQFESYDEAQIKNELQTAFSQTNNDDERIAIMDAALAGNMDKELLEKMGGVAGNGYSDEMLRRMTKSSNTLISSYAKNQLKRGSDDRISLNDFISSPDSDKDANSLRGYQAQQGSDWLSKLNGDTLRYVSDKNAGSSVFGAEALLNAATTTTNGNSIGALNGMIRNLDAGDMQNVITGKMLEGMSEQTAREIKNKFGVAVFDRAKNDVIAANKQGEVSAGVRGQIGL